MPGDWSVRRPRPGARRLGVRVRQRQLPRHRRHRRGRARPAPRRAIPTPARVDAAIDARRRLDGRHAVPRRRLGRVRRRQHPRRSAARLPVLRLRRGDRPAAAPTSPPTWSRCSAARRPRRDPGARPRGVAWLLASSRRPTARGSAGGAPTTSTARAPPCPRWSPPACRPTTPRLRRAVAWLDGHQNADGGWGEDLRSLPTTPRWRRPGRSTPSQTAWALLALLAAGERGGAAADAGVGLPGRAPSAPTAPGTSRGTPAPASPATSTSTTTCTGRCSRSWRSGRYVRGGTMTPDRRRAAAPRGRVLAAASGAPTRRRAHRAWAAGAPATAAARRRRRRTGAGGRGRLRRRRSTPACAPGRSWSPPRCGAERRSAAARSSCPAPRVLAAALRRAGFDVVTGPLVSSPRLVAGRRPAALAADAAPSRSTWSRRGSWAARARHRPAPPWPRCASSPTPPTHELVVAGDGGRRPARRYRSAARRSGRCSSTWAAARRPAHGRARRPAVVLRRRRAGHHRRRAGPRALRRARLRAPPDHPQHPRRRRARGGAARCSSTSSTRCPTARTVVLAAHGVAPGGARRGRRRASCT